MHFLRGIYFPWISFPPFFLCGLFVLFPCIWVFFLPETNTWFPWRGFNWKICIPGFRSEVPQLTGMSPSHLRVKTFFPIWTITKIYKLQFILIIFGYIFHLKSFTSNIVMFSVCSRFCLFIRLSDFLFVYSSIVNLSFFLMWHCFAPMDSLSLFIWWIARTIVQIADSLCYLNQKA